MGCIMGYIIWGICIIWARYEGARTHHASGQGSVQRWHQGGQHAAVGRAPHAEPCLRCVCVCVCVCVRVVCVCVGGGGGYIGASA